MANVGLGRAVARHDPVIAEPPNVASLSARVRLGGLPGGVQVESLLAVALLTRIEILQELGDFVVGEPGEADVDVGLLVQFPEEPGQ